MSRFQIWWGGFSYGPRLLTDMVPAMILLTILVGSYWQQDERRPWHQLGYILFFAAAIISVAIHSYGGLFYPPMLLSHGHNFPPHVDKAPYLLLDWRYPQFLTTPTSICKRNKTYFQDVIARSAVTISDYTVGEMITFKETSLITDIPKWNWWFDEEMNQTSTDLPSVIESTSQAFLPVILVDTQIKLKALFIGWSLPGADGVWSVCKTTDIVLGPARNRAPDEPLEIMIKAQGHQEQPVKVSINGREIGEVLFSQEQSEQRLRFDGRLLHSNQMNVVTLEIPQAFSPEGSGDFRLMGIFLENFVIRKISSDF